MDETVVSQCFTQTEATQDLLLRVTNVCSVCYDDLKIGDTIYYDLQKYRFLCECCCKKLSSQMDEACQVVREEDEGLFC